MVHTVHLNESEHAIKILRGLKKMNQEEDFCDFTIKVGDDVYRAHMNVVAAGSPYFKAMLKYNTKERQNREVELKNVDSECVRNCIDFMYTGKFDMPDGKAGDLLYVAVMMQLHDVTNELYDIIEDTLDVETFFETKYLARLFEYHDLSATCKAFYEENLLAISSLPEFEKEDEAEIVSILESIYPTEEEKLTVTLRWVGESPGKVEKIFDLMNLIRLEEISSQYLNDILENHPLVKDNLKLYTLMTEPSIKRMKTSETDSASGSSRGATLNSQFRSENCKLVLLDKFTIYDYSPVLNDVTRYHDEEVLCIEEFTAITLASYIYVLSGFKVHRLDCKDQVAKWQKMQSMIDRHGSRPPAVAFDGLIIVIGRGDDTPSKSVERLNPVQNSWSRLPYKPDAVSAAALVSVDDSVYCVGGEVPQNQSNTFCKFTPLSSSWTNLAPVSNPRSYCSAVAVGQKIIVLGGTWKCHNVKEVECYDISTMQWSTLAPMINDDYCHTVAHHVGGWIYAISLDFGKYVHKYDIANDRWYKHGFKSGKYMDVHGFVSIGLNLGV